MCLHLSFEKSLAKYDLTVAGWCVLISLYGDHASGISELSAYIEIDKASISRVVSRLVTRGLIVEKKGKDKRSGLLQLTNEGMDLIPFLIEEAQQNEDFYFENLSKDEKYCNPEAAKQYSEELVPLISGIFEKQDRECWIKVLTKYDLPFSKTQHIIDVVKDPMAWDNGYLVNYTFENGNTAAIPCTPVQFKANVAAPCERAPHLGEHTKEILIEIGYSEEKINELVDKKVVSTYKRRS